MSDEITSLNHMREIIISARGGDAESQEKLEAFLNSVPVEDTETPIEPILEIRSLDDLRRVMVVALGGDPDAQQTLNGFLKFDSPIERTNLPTTEIVKTVSYLDYVGKSLYPDEPSNPFSDAANSMSVAFMARQGEKSKQFVEIVKQTPSLSDLQTFGGGEQQGSVISRMFGRRNKAE